MSNQPRLNEVVPLDFTTPQQRGPSNSQIDWADVERRYLVLLAISEVASIERAGPSRSRTGHYDGRLVSLAMLDAIIGNVTPGQPTDREYVFKSIQPLLRMMDEAANTKQDEDAHNEIFEYLVKRLTNRSGDHKPHALKYLHYNSGQLAEKTTNVRILVEVFDRMHNEPVFEVSTEWKNIYLRLFGQSIEDEQVAQEAVLEAQIRSGRLQEAEDSARVALRISMHYRGDIRRRIDETRRNINRVDWGEETPETLNRAEEHVTERVKFEAQLLQLVHKKLNAEGSEYQGHVTNIQKHLRACMGTHQKLLVEIQEARQVFIEEHDRQRFNPPILDPKPHLTQDIMQPLLHLNETDVSLFDQITSIIAGFEHIVLPTLSVDIPYMLRPKPEDEHTSPNVLPDEETVTTVEAHPLPLDKLPDIRQRLTVQEATTLEAILTKAEADGYTSKELELLARVSLEPLDNDPSLPAVRRVSLGAPAFQVNRLRFDKGGLYILPNDKDAQ